jgi:eukaryotic-like serine/threonine-protein kinase
MLWLNKIRRVNTSADGSQWDTDNDPVVTSLDPDDSQRVGRFKIIGVLGEGGMGKVFLGVADGRYYAVKLIRRKVKLIEREQAIPERFQREIGILLSRVPPGVAPRLLAFDSTDEGPYFALEYVPGITLEQAVEGSGPLPSWALWRLLARTATQLQKIHEAGIVHRDLKPTNIMLVADGVQLIDFGIALDGIQERLTRGEAGCGTPGYQAPEQRQAGGTVTGRADVYALGAMLAYAASGHHPGTRPNLKPLRSMDPALARVAERCLADRFWARPIAARLVKKARGRELAGRQSWPQEVTSRIAKREHFIDGLRIKEKTAPPVSEPRPFSRPSPGGRVKRLLAAGVRAGIASAIVTGLVYGVVTALESGLGAGLRVALVNGIVNGIGAGLTFGLLHGFAAPFRADARRPVRHARRTPGVSALLLMIPVGMAIGVGYGLVLGSVPGLAAGLMAAVGTGTTMKAWGR